jgi:hypothetical protein
MQVLTQALSPVIVEVLGEIALFNWTDQGISREEMSSILQGLG